MADRAGRQRALPQQVLLVGRVGSRRGNAGTATITGDSVDLRDSAPKEIADHVEKIMSREVQATPRKGEKGYTKGDGRGPAR